MRWLFLLLLLVNIGYVAWELRRESMSQQQPQPINPNVESIILLSELGIATAVDKPMLSDDEDQAEKGTDTPAIAGAERVAETGVTDSEPATGSKYRGKQIPEVELAAAQAQPDTPPPVEQALPATGTTAPKPGPGAPKAVAAQSGIDQCFTLGPFSDLTTLRKLTREIKDYVLEASFRSAEEKEQTKYRVYLKSAGSMKRAKALTRELVNKGIKDYFIITSGPNKYGISLGYFSSKERAYRHARRVEKAGFDAIAEPVFRNYTIYWLDYRIQAGKQIPQRVFDDLLENKASRLSRSCA